jgi:superfamily II DNA helicase RecQ
MSLQYKFIIVPVKGIHEAESELNRFLRGVRVVNSHRHFVDQGENSFWGIAVEYLSGDGSLPSNGGGQRRRNRVDYKESLAPRDFALFAKLREWRKEAAGREAVPVYTIFTNEQLAHIAEKRIDTKAGLQEVEGIGESKIKRYAESVIAIVKYFAENPEETHATSGEPLPSDPES